MKIRVATDDALLRASYPVMAELRPHLALDEFLAQVRRQEREGYRIAVIDEDGRVVAAAGYRFGENLAWGRFLYVDDLVTTAELRSRGHGRRLLDWLAEEARKAGCRELHLDSGVQRFGAHRCYLGWGMDLTSHHFRIVLEPPPRS
jgi:GNAT superfamily N-acetyltransferase